MVHNGRGIILANDAVGLLLHLHGSLPGLPDVLSRHVLQAVLAKMNIGPQIWQHASNARNSQGWL